MRLGFPFFVGLFIVLVGLSMIFESIFRIHLPLLRIAAGLFIIYLGARMLIGPRVVHTAGTAEGSAAFSDQRFEPHPNGRDHLKYDVIFGRGIVDLSHLAPLHKDVFIEVNTVFGESTVIVDPAVPLEVQSSSVFGSARMPDAERVSFGNLTYRPPRLTTDAPTVHLKLSVVFASTNVRNQGQGPVEQPERAERQPT